MCTVTCPSGACPAGLSCGSDGFCHKSPGERCGLTDGGSDGRGSDAAGFCYGAGFLRVCLASEPTSLVAYTATTVDTNDAACDLVKTQDDSSKVCIYIGKTITFSGNVRITGPNPVAFLGTTAVLVSTGATVDVASHAGMLTPAVAGVSSAICGNGLSSNGLNDPTANGGGGGAGGTFRSFGGSGGAGAGAMMTTTGGGSPGMQLPALTTVRAGCPGGTGGSGAMNSGGGGGAGGGAVYLMSGSAVRVLGQINASGAGGGRPTATGGGGGGGTGGFIGLDAPAYDLSSGTIFAVGGSGAAGGVASGGGIAGNEATGASSPGATTTATTAGSGGAGGATGAGTDGTGASLGGGGGGGGAAGFIGIANLPSVLAGTFAPTPVSMN